MIAKNCAGRVPEPGPLTQADRAILAEAERALETARRAMAEQGIHTALAAIFAVVADANRYFAGQEPWALRKSDPVRMATVLYTTAETLRRVALLCQPFMPQASAKLLDLLAVAPDRRSFADLADAAELAPGTALPAPEPVFPRYVEEAESA
jgi:methionyl-tRNA synthetase